MPMLNNWLSQIGLLMLLAELAVVARGSPCLLVGVFNVEPTKISCLSKGISAGLWVDLDAAWSAAQGRQPAVTCKRSWNSSGGSRRDFLATAALFSCSVSSCRWLQPHFAVSAVFDCDRWSSQVTQPIRCTPLWPGFLLLIKVGALNLLRSRGSGKYMMIGCGLCLVLIVMALPVRF